MCRFIPYPHKCNSRKGFPVIRINLSVFSGRVRRYEIEDAMLRAHICANVRYHNIYVRSRKAGEHVLASVRRWLHDRLKLRLNEEKSAVDRPWKGTFLGYGMTEERETRLTVSKKHVKRFKTHLRMLFRRGRGRILLLFIGEDLLPVLRGWFEYFRLAGVTRVLEELDGWIRRHLRKILWRQWKRPGTRCVRLRNDGLSGKRARKSSRNGRGPWCNAMLGLHTFTKPSRNSSFTALVSTRF